jgi:hypothetical protein
VRELLSKKQNEWSRKGVLLLGNSNSTKLNNKDNQSQPNNLHWKHFEPLWHGNVQTYKHAPWREHPTYQVNKAHRRKCQKMDHIPYKQTMSNIMYTMIATRLDIATIIVVVNHFIQDLGLCNIGEKWKGSWGICKEWKIVSFNTWELVMEQLSQVSTTHVGGMIWRPDGQLLG